MEEEKQYTVRLEAIHLAEKFLKKTNKEYIEHQFSVSFSKTLKQLGNIKLMIRATVMPMDSEEELGGINVFFEYQVTGCDDDENLPQDVNYALRTVSIGTLRGIMFSEFRGTNLHKAILPTMDISKFD